VRLTRIILTALAVAVCMPSVGSSQYTPQWRVGDWWVVKVWKSDLHDGMRWRPQRYDVSGIEKVDGADCFVLQEKIGDTTPATDGERILYYVRTDNYRVIRKDEYFRQAGKLVGPRTSNCPEGMFGPTPLQPRLPLFPLDSVAPRDSTFHDYQTVLSWAALRQFWGAADSALLNRYLSEPNPSGGRPVQPRGGKTFSVLSEEGAPREPGGPDVPHTYTLQLWSTDYPWRLYEEWGQYAPPGSGARQPGERSWLIACGRSGSR
jgi:hypothetical protein